MKPLIRVLTTGGTIASTTTARGYAPTLTGSELLEEALRFFDDPPRIEVEELTNKTSYMLDERDVRSLVARVRAAMADEGVDAAVLVGGTAAMEELAFLLALKVRLGKPVVLTGAMLNASHPGWDGRRNMIDALRYASDPSATGVTVVIAGRAHSARDVVKVHRTSVEAFQSHPRGPVALIDADRVVPLCTPPEMPLFEAEGLGGPVDIIVATLASDGRLFDAALTLGARGIVVQGFPGGGGLTASLMDSLHRSFVSGPHIPVVLTSRSPFGRSTAGAGGGAGPADVAAAGGILAGDLSAAKARLLLMSCLAEGFDSDRIRATFAKVAP